MNFSSRILYEPCYWLMIHYTDFFLLFVNTLEQFAYIYVLAIVHYKLNLPGKKNKEIDFPAKNWKCLNARKSWQIHVQSWKITQKIYGKWEPWGTICTTTPSSPLKKKVSGSTESNPSMFFICFSTSKNIPDRSVWLYSSLERYIEKGLRSVYTSK